MNIHCAPLEASSDPVLQFLHPLVTLSYSCTRALDFSLRHDSVTRSCVAETPQRLDLVQYFLHSQFFVILLHLLYSPPGNISFTQFFVILLFLFYSPAVLFLLFLSITTFEKLYFTLAFLTYYFCLRRKIFSIPSWLSRRYARSWFQLSIIAKA